MKIVILFTGKTKFSYLDEGINDYLSRLKHYIKSEMIIVPDLRNAKNLSETDIKQKEGENILKHIPDNSSLIILDEKGKAYNSVELAGFFQKRINERRDICILVGGAYGFSEEIYEKADFKLSLSELTFSHQLVRLIFMEQIYRAFTIIRGEKYHHQ